MDMTCSLCGGAVDTDTFDLARSVLTECEYFRYLVVARRYCRPCKRALLFP